MKSDEIKITNVSDHMRRNIRALVAVFIGNEDRTSFIKNPITPDMLPADMVLERSVLEAVFSTRSADVPPTVENITRMLSLQHPEWQDHIQALAAEKPEDLGADRALTEMYRTFYNEERMRIASVRAQAISERPDLTTSEKYEQIAMLMGQIAPSDYEISTYTQNQWVADFIDRNQRRMENRRKGIDDGPHLPFPSMRKFLPNLEWNQFSTLMGDTGGGKTSLAFLVAEFNALEAPINADAVIISLETPEDILQRRQISRRTLIPFAALANVDILSEQWNPIFQERYVNAMNETRPYRGELRYAYAPSRNLQAVVSEMRTQAELSRLRGKAIVFIIDYLQKFNWMQVYARDPTTALEAIGEELAGATRIFSKKTPCHTFLLAQMNVDTGEAFRTKNIKRISQFMAVISREAGPLEIDAPVMVRKEGKNVQLKDALGNPRFYGKRGDEFGYVGKLKIVKSNDGGVSDGREIPLLYEGPFFRIIERPS